MAAMLLKTILRLPDPDRMARLLSNRLSRMGMEVGGDLLAAIGEYAELQAEMVRRGEAEFGYRKTLQMRTLRKRHDIFGERFEAANAAEADRLAKAKGTGKWKWMPDRPRLARDHDRTGLERAERYEEDVLSGAVPACRWTKLAVRRHRKDLNRARRKAFDWRWDPHAAERPVKFIEALTHIDGPMAPVRDFHTGEALELVEDNYLTLEPFQAWWVTRLFGWVRKDGKGRRFTQAFFTVGRKSGKTTLSAAIALYLMLEDREVSARIYCLAPTKSQGALSHDIALRMVTLNKPLQEAYGFEPHRGRFKLHHVGTNSTMEVLAREQGAGELQGYNPSGSIVDEVSQHRDSKTVEAMIQGGAARRQPLTLMISTAGSNRESPGFGAYKRLRKVLSGKGHDDAFFGVEYSAEPNDDESSPATWRKACPGLGTLVREDYIAGLHAKSQLSTRDRTYWRTYQMNQWVAAEQAWLHDAEGFDRLAGDVPFKDFKGKPAWVGIDPTVSEDLYSACFIFRDAVDDGDYHYYARWLFFLPLAVIDAGGAMGDNLEKYAAWRADGHLIPCGERQINDAQLWDMLHPILQEFDVQAIAYDMNRIGGLKRRLEEWYPNEHFAVFGTPDALTFPMEKTEGLIKEGRLTWHRNPVASWCFANCGVKISEGHLRRMMPVRGNETDKIDGVIAWLNGLKACLLAEDPVTMSDLDGWYA